MGKEPRPKGQGDKGGKASPGPEVAADSRPTPGTSVGAGVYYNDRGELCYGTHCFTMALDEQRREIRINVKRGGGCELDPLVDAMRRVLGEGARTVYEVESEWKPDKDK